MTDITAENRVQTVRLAIDIDGSRHYVAKMLDQRHDEIKRQVDEAIEGAVAKLAETLPQQVERQVKIYVESEISRGVHNLVRERVTTMIRDEVDALMKGEDVKHAINRAADAVTENVVLSIKDIC